MAEKKVKLTLEQIEEQARIAYQIAKNKREERDRRELLPQLKKKLEGKFFKYRNNYSCPEKPSDYWWMYIRFKTVNSCYEAHTTTFQICKGGNVEMQFDNFTTPRISSSYTEISKDEYNKAKKKFLAQIKEHLS